VNGEAEVTLSIQAKLATTFAAVFPGTTSELLCVMNDALLPGDDGRGDGARVRKGREMRLDWVPEPLTSLGDRAARENNEMA
jgi:hypothetical protein